MAIRWPSRVFLTAISIITSIAWAFVDVLSFLGHAAWKFVDPGPLATAALERLARAFALLRDRSTAFGAFVKCALTHPSYTAGHFDPGRMPA